MGICANIFPVAKRLFFRDNFPVPIEITLMSGITKQEFAMKLPTDDQPPSDQYPFLQDSSHLTHIPSEQRGAGAEVKIRDQDNPKKEFPPTGSSAPRVTLDFKLDFTIRFEDLTFGKLLGQGAYGKVFAGEWKFNPVAIKQYTAQDFSDQTREEIRKEASIMATVSAQSDYLVRLRGVILDKPNYSLVMEYLPGGDLFHLLKSSQEMTWPMCYRMGLDMTIGLHHLHGHGALHRDLKSLNVLLDMNWRAKLADFGLSTLKTSSASTTAGGFKGTVLWSAPELFKRGAKASVASDIYSLGMILWELVSRQIPFADAATPEIAMDWVKSGEQENIPSGTPEDFKALILDCWDKDPAKRPKADVVAKRLDTLWRQSEQKKTVASLTDLSGVPLGSPKPETPASLPPAPQPGIRKVILEPVSPPSSVLSQSRFTIAPAPKSLMKPVDVKELGQLLRFVAEGEQDKAETLIQKDQNLLLHAGTVMDLSGREFNGITAFQYALWALDWHMWKMIQKYLPEEQQREQFEVLETKGTLHGKHFSLQPLIEALQSYAVNYDSLNWKMFESKRKHHWQKIVGGAQRLLPVHVINEYCRPDRSFRPCPQFTEASLPRGLNGGDRFTVSYKSGGGLGQNYGLVRGSLLSGAVPHDWARRYADTTDLFILDMIALQSLSKVRIQQLELLASHFKVLGERPATPLKKEQESKKLTPPSSWGSQSLLPAPKPALKPVDQKDLSQLLRYVAEGEQDKAEALIQKDKNLLLHTGTLKDLSGREFKQITAFQYALWAMDWHMWVMIQKYLPQEAQAQQLQELEAKGTAYGKHFCLQGLTGALQTYVDNAEKVWKYDRRVADHWCKVVGGEQKLLPVHVVNEYCRADRPFEPCPQEWEAKLPRTREMNVWDSTRSKRVKRSWFVAPSSKTGLGLNFAFYRYNNLCCVLASHGNRWPREWVALQVAPVMADLKALQSLWKTRTQQLELLRSQLLSVVNQSQVYGR
jgi:serine/threonine protein kinase